MVTSKDHVEQGSPPARGSYSPSEIERLGRERPEVFTSIWMELGFCFALLGSMFVSEYFISGFNILLPPLTADLNIPSQAETWPSSVFSLVTGAFLLPFGRLADMFGGYIVFNLGLLWFVVWSIIAGFSQNYIMLIVCRALQGFGPAAFLPSGIMLLGSIVSASSNYARKITHPHVDSTVLALARILSSVSTARLHLSASSQVSSSPVSPPSSSHGIGSST